jgi:hypothetical protein
MSGSLPDRPAVLLRVVTSYGLGAATMGAVNILILVGLQSQYPAVGADYLRLCVSPLFAAVQEPITSKLLAAGVLLAWTARADQADWLRGNWARVATLGGLWVGVVEVLVRILGGAVRPELLPPVVLHVVTALVVGWAVFRTAGRQRNLVDYHAVLLAVSVAVLLHVGWNRYVGPVLADPLPC